MSADFWMGCFVGSAFLLVAVSFAIALSRRMSPEHRKAHDAMMHLLREANVHRWNSELHLRRIAEVCENQGGRK